MTQMRSDTFNNNKTCFGSAIPFLKCSPAIHLCNHHHQRQYLLNTESVAKQEKGQNPVNTEYRKCQEAGEMTKSLEYGSVQILLKQEKEQHTLDLESVYKQVKRQNPFVKFRDSALSC